MNTAPSPLRTILTAARPWSLLAAALMYVLGGGIAHFLGVVLDWTVFWLGLATVVLLMAGSRLLRAYYDIQLAPIQRRREEQRRLGLTQLQAAVTLLAVGAALTVLLIIQGSVNLTAYVFLGLAFLLAFFYGVPPLRLASSGYSELSSALLITNLVPALAFLFQTGSVHRLLVMTTFPLTALYLAMTLAQSLEHYYADIKEGNGNLMTRMGWQSGMNLHNLLVPGAFLLLGVAALLGMPWSLTWPPLLTLPLAGFQVWQMVQLMSGGKTRWRLLNLTAAATFVIAAYLISLALWT